MRILLIEDHVDVAETISDYLLARGHKVDVAGNGELGFHLAASRNYDVLILDRILPGLDGGTLCSRLRNDAGKNTPVLMVTALTTTSDKVGGFAAGADDYLVKPFDLPELEARLMALNRRANASIGGQRLQIADLVYDANTQQIRRAGREISLSPSGRRILEYLMRHPNRVVSRDELGQQLWGSKKPEGEVLRVHIHALRSAIDTGHQHKLLQTVRGVGYRLAVVDGP
jgi:DNA-binding response OmpR family regulator